MQSFLVIIRHGGVAMYPLLLCSVLTVAIVLERIGVFHRAKVNYDALLNSLRALAPKGDRESARQLCAQTPLPLGPVAAAGLAKVGRSSQEIDDAMAHAGDLAIQQLEGSLPVLGTIGGIAPFIGLFGTVIGIMRAFHNIQKHGQAGTAVVAGGVSEALIATAAGLLVAVLAVVAYNSFLNRINRLEVSLDAARSELLYLYTEDWQCVPSETTAAPAGNE